MRVSVANSGHGFSVAAGQSVLEAALEARLNLPHGCKGGNCGACRSRLLGGEVSYPRGAPLGLSAAQIAAGYVLLCQARAVTDLLIDDTLLWPAGQTTLKRSPSRVERVERWSDDVLGIFLRLPAVETFTFEAGQYLDILLPGGRRRSFSIASPPHDARPLELHIRRVAGGAFTDELFTTDPLHALFNIEGPLGHFAYRDGGSAPMLLVGGGTGLAPLKSIIRHVLENGVRRQVTLYWGARTRRDLYAHGELEALARRHANFCYRPVLSAPDAAWSGRTGWVHEAVLNDLRQGAAPKLDMPDIYASGPPAMIAALHRDFVCAGADPARLYVDPFDYAEDPPFWKRTTASTKS